MDLMFPLVKCARGVTPERVRKGLPQESENKTTQGKIIWGGQA